MGRISLMARSSRNRPRIVARSPPSVSRIDGSLRRIGKETCTLAATPGPSPGELPLFVRVDAGKSQLSGWPRCSPGRAETAACGDIRLSKWGTWSNAVSIKFEFDIVPLLKKMAAGSFRRPFPLIVVGLARRRRPYLAWHSPQTTGPLPSFSWQVMHWRW